MIFLERWQRATSALEDLNDETHAGLPSDFDTPASAGRRRLTFYGKTAWRSHR
jgi:hypothetical protein